MATKKTIIKKPAQN